MGDSDLPAAILTNAQRDWLVGRNEYDNAAADREMRKRIRKRLPPALNDFDTLVKFLDPEDRKKAFEDTEIYDWQNRCIMAGVGFLYIVLDDSEEGSIDGYFSRLAKDGIKAALVRDGVSVEDIEVTVKVKRGGDLGEIPRDNLSDLSQRELYQLTMAGEITQDEFSEALETKQSEE